MTGKLGYRTLNLLIAFLRPENCITSGRAQRIGSTTNFQRSRSPDQHANLFRRFTLFAIPTRPLICLLLTMFTTAPALAQNNDYSFTIELQGPDRPLTAAYSIQLLDVGNRNIIATAFGNTAGDFSFRGVPRGDYLARVVD